MAGFRQERQLAWALADLAVAVALSCGALADVAALGRQAPLAVAAMLAVTCTASVAWRRRAPAASVFVAVTAMLAYQLSTADPRMTFEPYAVALCYYLLGRRQPAGCHRAIQAALLGYGLVTLGFEFLGSSGSWPFHVAEGWTVYVLLPFGLGVLAARYGAMSHALTATTGQLRREQQWQAERAAAHERNRVARELHDVLGHCVSVMVIQAGAAGLVAQTDAARARGALDAVVACGRAALRDLRRIMGAARRDDDPAELAPGLAQLRSLAERAGDAGIPTDLRVECGNISLPAAVGLACYRVVQEALTNVMKHAGPARAEVRVRVESGIVIATIADTGSGTTAGPADPPGRPAAVTSAGQGYGISGLRERVALHGGWLHAGPRAGGYLVEAGIPVTGGPSVAQGDRPVPPTPDGADITETGGMPAALRCVRDLGRRWLDPLLVGCWLVALEAAALTSNHRQGPLVMNVAVVAAMALAGLWRRRAPLAFLAATALLSLPLSAGLASRDYGTLVGVYGVLIPPYAVGAWAKRSRAVAAIVIWAFAATAVGLAEHAPLGGLAGPLLAAGAAWSAGMAVRAQRELAARLRDSTTRLAAERANRARLAVADERARIARDLHMLVARSVVAMVVQAEAAREMLDVRPADALASMTAIESAGREALAEMRRILGVLRRPGEAPDRQPPRRLEQQEVLA